MLHMPLAKLTDVEKSLRDERIARQNRLIEAAVAQERKALRQRRLMLENLAAMAKEREKIESSIQALQEQSYRPGTPLQIIKSICADHFGVSLLELISPRRDRRVTRARQAAMYLARKYTPYSLPMIARSFGRDHTTVIHANEKISSLYSSDEKIRADIDSLSAQVRSQFERTNKNIADMA